MPQLVPLVLKDGKATPVDHTFIPREIAGGVSTLVESTGTPIGERRLTLSQNRTTSGRVKVIARLVIPVVQDAVVNGISKPTIVRTSYADVTLSFDSGSSTAEREDTVALIRSLLANEQTMVQAFAVDLEGLY